MAAEASEIRKARRAPWLPVAARVFVGGVWIFHGVFSKLLDGVPRHRLIIGRILGEEVRDVATPVIGLLECALGLWVLSAWRPRWAAAAQTAALAAMNTLEILFARDLLISAPGMVVLNAGFVTLIWWTALRAGRTPSFRTHRG